MAPSTDRVDVYARITSQIIAAIEAGAGSWRTPWHHDGASTSRPTNVSSSRPYRGINRLALWAAAFGRGYHSGVWGTYRAWAAIGAQVRRSEKATTVVLWKEIRSSRNDADDDGDHDEDRGRRLFARAFSVFNAAQVEGYTEQPSATPILDESARFPHADAFIGNFGVPTVFGSDGAFYRPSTDTVHMPEFAAFRDAPAFYGCWCHEMGHATGAPHRLNRDLVGRFGSARYAADEAVAELTASYILADLRITNRPRPEHAAYIASWLEVLKSDRRAIFTAAAKAQAAADWMHAQQPAAISMSEAKEVA